MPRGVSSKPAKHCHVYLIEAGHAVKIGRSSRLERRVSEIQVGSPAKVRLVHSWSLSIEMAGKLEGALHKLLRWGRLSGEWHKADPELIQAVGDRWLAGDVSGAEHLADLLRIEGELTADWEEAQRRALSRGLYRDPLARREAREDAEEAYRDLMDVVDERIGLGVLTEAERALERVRARLTP